MLKIGDFSKLSRVSVKTLRYYDEIGLLKPRETDHFTGYRYYTFDQLPTLHHILALKDLGLSLEQIGHLLREALTSDQLRGILRLRQSEIEQHIEEEQERLARLTARLKQIEQEDSMSTYAIVLKKLEPINIASVRDVIPAYPEQGHLWNELSKAMQAQKVSPNGPCFTIYHADEPEIDAEVCEPVDNLAKPSGRMKSYTLPGVELAACTVHHGPFVTLPQAYETLIRWIDDNGYQIDGPGREIYLRTANPQGSQTDPETVTEIQFPVRKK
ncbi:MAG: MerR family transcriptional regulator [Anaerolineales bacterium]|nr:MerR family transcriptional regulator [Anaerolineales bacterium]